VSAARPAKGADAPIGEVCNIWLSNNGRTRLTVCFSKPDLPEDPVRAAARMAVLVLSLTVRRGTFNRGHKKS
jgi:hypothetical protein